MQLIAALFGGGGLVLGGFMAYFVTDYFADIRVTKAVNAEIVRQQKLCDADISRIERESASHALETVSAGNEALVGMEPTPDDQEALKKLCEKEQACRDK